MLQVAKKHTGISVIVVFIIVLMGGYLSITLNTNAQEANQPVTMQSMFEYLRERIEDDPEFLFNVRFEVPLMDNDEIWWYIPYNSEDGEIVRVLGEVGSDYVCFFELAGSAPINRCTPFSNIVSVTYLGDF